MTGAVAGDEPFRRAAAIAELAQSLAAQGADTTALETDVAAKVAALVGDAVALWRRDDQGHIRLVAFSHRRPDRAHYFSRHAPRATHSDVVGVLPHVWAAGTPLVLDDEAVAQWLHVMQPAYQAYARDHGMVSLIVVPLTVRGSVVALLGVSRDEHPGHTDADLGFLQQLGSVVAVALEHDRLVRQIRQHVVEETRAHRAAHRAASTDPLTGLANRRLFTERLLASTAHDHQEAVVAVFDLDDFKGVNDAYGHAVGDAALVEVGRRLESVLAEQAPEPRRTFARLGGDEFAVLLTAPISADRTARLMAALQASLDEPLRVAGRDLRASLSGGVARGPASDGPALLRHADVAMYRAKRDRLGWAEYDPSDDHAAEVRLQRLSELDLALTGGGLVVHYQAIVPRGPAAQSDRRLVEALVRWQHPSRGLLSPAEFLPLAEQAGRMTALTEVVLTHVLSDLRRWTVGGQDVQVSVNVGADVLGGPGFVTGVLHELDRVGLPTSALCLELTESEVLSADGPALLEGLRARGLDVALDDFGTGYANLALLCELPLSRLKLDRSFVQRLAADARTRDFVGGLVGLLHGLGLPVVAEGVEEQGIAVALDGLGVAYQQGFLHSRPQPWAQVSRTWPVPASCRGD